jgi:hypothetical protein
MPLTDFLLQQALLTIFTKTSIQLVAQANMLQLEIDAFLARQGVVMSTAEIQALIYGGDSTVAVAAFDKFRNVARRIIAGTVNSGWGTGTDIRQSQDDDGELYEWRVDSKNPCPDCSSRNGQRMSLSAWQAAGLPQSGFSVCGTNCKCKLDRKGSGPYNYSRSKGQT